MNPLTITVCIILAGSALALITYPLWQQSRIQTTVSNSRLTLGEVEARYQAALASIKDLMFDYEMGKVSTEDYESLLALTKSEAAQLRKQMDQLSASVDEPGIDPALGAQIEALIAQARKQPPPTNGNRKMAREISSTIRQLKRNGRSVSSPHCPNCNATYKVGDAFCAKCGQTPAATVIEEDVIICPQCNIVVEATDAFCAGCGSALEPMNVLQQDEVPVI